MLTLIYTNPSKVIKSRINPIKFNLSVILYKLQSLGVSNYNTLELRSLYMLRVACIVAILPKSILDIKFENEKLYNSYYYPTDELRDAYTRLFKLFFLFGLKKKKVIFIDSTGRYNKLLNILN